jgi:hypothetical protein
MELQLTTQVVVVTLEITLLEGLAAVVLAEKQ